MNMFIVVKKVVHGNEVKEPVKKQSRFTIPINKPFVKEEVKQQEDTSTNDILETFSNKVFEKGFKAGAEEERKKIVNDLLTNFNKAQTVNDFCEWIYKTYIKGKA